MAYTSIKSWLQEELETIETSGLFKNEKLIVSSQGAQVDTPDGEVINFCANNYLGLADHPEILATIQDRMKTHGFGMASVRFICGTQDIHKELEDRITNFMGTEDTILYTSCFDANTGLFETLLGPDDALISDSLNHASIIDGVRLCRAKRKIYQHSDMSELEERLKETQDSRFRLIATDGVFSMQGDLALLDQICDLADKYDALVMVDDSHATAFVGPNGKGTAEEMGVMDRVDIVTSTLGKALGGASGGFTTARKEIVSILRQRSRPYLFSNTLAPPIVAGAIKALDIAESQPELRQKLWENTKYFRTRMTDLGFDIIPGIHPIVPIMVRDELKNVAIAKSMNDLGIFVVSFSFPVVPKGEARIRVQISAAHNRDHLDKAISAFESSGKEHGII
ncbi:MAG: glycine C-acetyltransferase [Chloroflexota bacterium]|nr:glycine C-acetyltransferase [Chloroflexota bacterium]